METAQKQIRCTLNKKLVAILKAAKSKESTRYAIEQVNYDADKKELAATDGRHSVVIKRDLPIKTGLYGLYGNELILAEDAGKFPRYEDILPPENDCEKITSNYEAKGFFVVMAKAGIGIDIFLHEKLIKALVRTDDLYEFFVRKDDPKTRPLYVKCEGEFDIKAVFMPFNTD